jgi:hypothetical protein
MIAIPPATVTRNTFSTYATAGINRAILLYFIPGLARQGDSPKNDKILN